jgi:Heparinase II/III N-terminus/Heparinase II/III-like protein
MKKVILILISVLLLVLSAASSDPEISIESKCIQNNTDNIIDSIEVRKLLSRINLNAAGLEKVKATLSDPLLAVNQLLIYYQTRTSVNHPVNRLTKIDMFGKCASEKDIKVADNALNHIFIGQGAYPPYFCGNDINWNTRPVPDKEWVWQLNRMPSWQSMALAYWHTNDEKYAHEWCYQLVDWTKKNPRDSLHDYAWRSIEAGIRGNSWTGLFQRFLDSPSFTPEVLTAFLNSCYDHAEFLMTRYSKGSNWALMEAEGMAFIAMTFPEFKDSEKWRDEAITRLNIEIQNQVYSDGHQRELALSYHMGCIAWFTRTYDLALMNGQKDAFPEAYSKIVEKMCEVPLKLGFSDGSTAQFGDSWSGKPGSIFGKMKEWAHLYNRPDFLYVATEGKEGNKPDSTAYALTQSGYYSMRSTWDRNAICMVLKNGPDGGGHCHPDNGTFELYAGGRHLMPDAGSYIYSGDPENRAWFRQTKVHQTLTLNGLNTAYAPKLLLWKSGKNLDILVVENESYPDLTHRRAMLFVNKKFFVIIDDAFGDGSGDIDLHFQLAPGNALFDNTELSVNSSFPEGWNVMVQSMNQKGMKLVKEEGQVSFVYTIKEPRPAFCYSLHKERMQKGVRFVTVVLPYKDYQPIISVRIKGDPKPGSSKIDLEILEDGKQRLLSYDLNDQ